MQSSEWAAFEKQQKAQEKSLSEETRRMVIETAPSTTALEELVPALYEWRIKQAQAKAAVDAMEELLTLAMKPDTAATFKKDGYTWRVEHNLKQRNTVDKKALQDELGGVPTAALPSIVDVDLTIKLSKLDSAKLSIEERELLAKVIKISNSSEIKLIRTESEAAALVSSHDF